MGTGRDRRRKDPLSRIRRTLYGLMLSLPHVAHADPTWRQPASAQTVIQPQLAKAGGTAVWLDPAAHGLDELITGVQFSIAGSDSPLLHTGKITDSAIASLASLRHGAEFDFALPTFGQFHLNLFAKRDPRHWQLNPEAIEANPQRAWSVGGAVEMMRVGEHGRRSISIVPQLVLDLDELVGAPGQLEAIVQYNHWRGDQEYASASRAPQVTMKWRF
jgi:hypothetical protein